MALLATGEEGKASALRTAVLHGGTPWSPGGWHPWIAEPFSRPLPVPEAMAARFKPAGFHKNVYYCSKSLETAVYEQSYHFMKQRLHLPAVPPVDSRIGFSVGLAEESVTDIRAKPEIARIMDRGDFSASHAFIRLNPDVRVLLYPSCRDPGRQDNFGVFELPALGRTILRQQPLTLHWDPGTREAAVPELGLSIAWASVS